MPSSSKTFLSILTTSCLLAVILTCCKNQQKQQPHNVPIVPPSQEKEKETEPVNPVTERSLLTWSEDEERVLIDQIRVKLQPKTLLLDENNVVLPHQFLHLHHMKTGGTSIDHMLKCARQRLTDDLGYSIQHFSIHECARGQFRKCVADVNDPCRPKMQEAATMSLCSALKHALRFGWDDANRIKAFTVLRNPVDRVWSMYRFQTRMCYSCKPLLEIYDMIDNDRIYGYDYLCLAQLQNHETANLLTSDWPENSSEDDIVAEAVQNLKSFFTVIGLTEELTLTAQILGDTFPWLNKTIEGSMQRCSLPHDNSSPINNHCIMTNRTDGGPGYLTSHWDLPDHPDEETRKAIEAHNQLDLKLYEAAVQYFKLQKIAYEANQAASRRN